MREIERQIIEKIVDSILAEGFAITVSDGEEFTVNKSTDKKQIMAEVAATDETYLHVIGSKNHGWIWLVHGNDEDVICDYIDNDIIEDLLSDANELARKFRGESA